MTRGVYTENLASFVLAVVAEVLARLCFEVPVTPPQRPSSHLSVCYMQPLFIFC